MPNDTKPKKKVVERMDRTLIQVEPGKFIRMPQLHGKDKNLTITTKTYGSSGKLKKTKEQTRRYEEEGYGKATSAKSIKTSKYDNSGNVRKSVDIGYEKKIGRDPKESSITKTVTKGDKVKEKNVNFVDVRRLSKMNIK
jgi:hypothetical protein